jgi:hypothetical protein
LTWKLIFFINLRGAECYYRSVKKEFELNRRGDRQWAEKEQKMKKLIAKNVLGIGGMLILFAAPALPSTVFNFNFDGGSTSAAVTGTGATTSGSFKVDNVTETGGVTASWPSSLSGSTLLFQIAFNNSTGNLTITSLAASTCNPCGTAEALTDLGVLYNASTTLTGGVTGPSLNETVSGTWTGVNTTFLTELGLAAGTTFTISGSISGSSTAVSSDTLALTAQAPVVTPEPASMFLFGAGLLTIGILARKRRVGTAR